MSLTEHAKPLDVLQLVLWYYEINPTDVSESLKLEDVCRHFRIPLNNAHDALFDVRATAELAQAVSNALVDFLLEKFGQNRDSVRSQKSKPLTEQELDAIFGDYDEEIPF